MFICGCNVYLATELILHRKVNKADASGDQGINESYCVQPGLELGRYHAHEDLPAEGLDAVLSLHTLAYSLCRQDENGKKVIMSSSGNCLSRELTVPVFTRTGTVGAPAVPARAVFDGGGGGQLHTVEQAGTWGQLHTLSIQLTGQGYLHGFVGKC